MGDEKVLNEVQSILGKYESQQSTSLTEFKKTSRDIIGKVD